MISNKLNILWTSGDVRTAHTMLFMYAVNAKLNKWFDEINIIIWGSSATLVAEDISIQGRIEIAKEAGINICACIACCNKLGVDDKLKELGIEVRSMGNELTEIIKSGEKLITI